MAAKPEYTCRRGAPVHCRAGAARATGQAEAAVLGADAGGGGCLSRAPRVCSREFSPSWPRERALGSPEGGVAAGHGDQGADGSQLPSGGGRYFIYRPPPGQLRAVQSASDGHNTPDSDSGEADGGSSPRPLVGSSSRGAPSPASGELPSMPCTSRCGFDLAGKSRLLPCKLDALCSIFPLQIGCALFHLPSAGPPERISALVSCHGELEPEMHRRRCKSLCFQWSEQTEKKKTDLS